MSHFLLKKLLMFTACVIVLSISPSSSMDAPSEIKFSSDSINSKTWNFNPGNTKLIYDIRAFHYEHGTKAEKMHNPLLIPHAKHLHQTMQRLADKNVNIPLLQKEVLEKIENMGVSALWLHFTHFRFLALLSDIHMTKTETELFEHTPSDPEHYKMFFKTNKNGTPLLLNADNFIEELYKATTLENTVPKYRLANLSKENFKLIKSEITKHLDYPILYPFLDKALFHPRFIINCWLNHVYLIGMPTQHVENVHGEVATSLGFAFHDWFHQKINTLLNDINFYCQLQISEAKFKNPNVNISEIVRLSAQKYNLIMNTFKHVNNTLSKDNNAFTGLFFLLHEFPSFSQALFEKSNPNTIFEELLENSLKQFDNYDSWHNPEDLFETCPLTGKSSLTPKKIIQLVQERIYAKDDLSICPQSLFFVQTNDSKATVMNQITDETKKRELRQKWFGENCASIGTNLTSSQFIDITFTFKNGDKRKCVFPTLKRKLNNFGAVEGMLKFAKKPIDQPNLTGNLEENRKITIDFIKQTNRQIHSTMEDLVLQAKISFGEGPESFTNIFLNEFKSIDSQIAHLKKSPNVLKLEQNLSELDKTITLLESEIEEMNRSIAKNELIAQNESSNLTEEKSRIETLEGNEKQESMILFLNSLNSKVSTLEEKFQAIEAQKIPLLEKMKMLSEVSLSKLNLSIDLREINYSEIISYIHHLNSFAEKNTQ